MAHLRRKDYCAEAYAGHVRPVAPTGRNNQIIHPTIDLETLPADSEAPVDFVDFFPPSSPRDDMIEKYLYRFHAFLLWL